jgi:hypothetical protein
MSWQTVRRLAMGAAVVVGGLVIYLWLANR